MNSDARVGVYYCPAPEDPLFHAGAAFLGRDPESGAPRVQPALPDIAEVTADAGLYGFHATLKPPMRLASGRTWFALLDAAKRLAEQIAPFALPPLAVTDVHGFLALRETAASPPLQALADVCVANLDQFRAPPSDAELAGRRKSGLTPAQEAMLLAWGYPYVFETWFFHMTLTRRLSPAEHAIWRPEAEQFFAAALNRPRMAADICLFTQTGPGAPFLIAERIPLRG